MNNSAATILQKEQLTKDIYYFNIQLAQAMKKIKAGQFINVQVPNRPDMILKRPFGIIDYDYDENSVSFAVQERGEGTKALCAAKAGDKLDVMMPLGNGFQIDDDVKKIALVGGGIGVFPLLSVLKKHGEKEIYSFLGYKNKESVVFAGRFERRSTKTFISSDDGSIGEKGFITDRVAAHIGSINPDLVLACGPTAMFKSLKKVMANYPGIVTNVSLEERMGCGFGACLACVCETNKNGLKHYDRVCKEGPVFNLNEVVFNEQ